MWSSYTVESHLSVILEKENRRKNAYSPKNNSEYEIWYGGARKFIIRANHDFLFARITIFTVKFKREAILPPGKFYSKNPAKYAIVGTQTFGLILHFSVENGFEFLFQKY